MNVKMTLTVSLAIILFISGVYCPPTEENEFPSQYPLQSCKSNNEYLLLGSSSSAFEITQSEQNPRRYCLTETLLDKDSTRQYCFKKLNVHFLSMRDAELTMIIYPFYDQNIEWNVTCVHPSVTQARKFYKDMTHERSFELILMLSADYLEKPNDVALEFEVNLFVDTFLNHNTVVVKDDDDDVILIFPTNNVYEIIKSGDTEISLYITFNPEERVLYKFGLFSELMTSVLREIMYRLCRHIEPAYAEGERQWVGNPLYEGLFNRIENSIEHQMERTRDELSELRGASTL